MLCLQPQLGCIPQYSDFVGSQDSRGDQVGNAGASGPRSGDDAGEVVQPDITDSVQRACIDDVCVCKPDCAGKECDPDSCGGSCGDCTGEDSCHSGVCKPGPCTPYCTGKECGSDGCGGTCGSCQPEEYCDDGLSKPRCGDGTCGVGETCCTCAEDCGSCCGNGLCDCGEAKQTCPDDCGEPACTEEEIAPLLDCVNIFCKETDDLTGCVMENCVSQFASLQQSCSTCIVANISKSIQEIVSACS